MIKNTDNKNLKSLKKSGIHHELAEDATKYGEFVTSYFSWVGLDKQKSIVNKIENVTKKEKR